MAKPPFWKKPPLVLEKFGSGLYVRGFRLMVSDGGEKTIYQPHNLPFDSVYFLTHTGNLSLESLHFLANENVPVFTMNYRGELETSVIHRTAGNSVRLAQYRAYSNPKRRREISKRILEDKRQAQERVLATLGKPSHLSKMERAASNRYYHALGEVFQSLGYEWTGRKDANSKNFKASTIPNALINYGLSVMFARVRREIVMAGLDETIAFGHAIYEDRLTRESLVWDLGEPFRSHVDEGVIRMLETKPKVTMRDFDHAPDYSLLLWPWTGKRLIGNLHLEDAAIRDYIQAFAKSL